jgi:hypothetical protein
MTRTLPFSGINSDFASSSFLQASSYEQSFVCDVMCVCSAKVKASGAVILLSSCAFMPCTGINLLLPKTKKYFHTVVMFAAESVDLL